MAEDDKTDVLPAKKPQRFRRLKVAWTVFFAVLTVALCVLWVRSYWRQERLSFRVITHPTWYFVSFLGHITIGADMGNMLGEHANIHWNGYDIYFRLNSAVVDIPYVNLWRKAESQNGVKYGFGAWSLQFGYSVCAPHWFYVMVFGGLATLPWLPFRFSLRTMLIATTLVAVVLGLVVLSMKR